MSTPEQTRKDEMLGEVLALINSARVAVGESLLVSLPKGKPRSGDCCVLARALPDARWVYSYGVEFNDERIAEMVAVAWGSVFERGYDHDDPDDEGDYPVAHLHAVLHAFREEFDAQIYPELIEGRADV